MCSKAAFGKVAKLLCSLNWSMWGKRWRLLLVIGAAFNSLLIASYCFYGLKTIESSQVDELAVCLVGGAQAFDLTGWSIKENLLKAYPGSDVFLNVPIDENTHKLSVLLGTPRIASLAILPQGPMKEDEAALQVLKAGGSSNGLQGLLQYFDLVEGCASLIEKFERERGAPYRWIMRTRMDGFWSGRPPPLSLLDSSGGMVLTVPHGLDFNGVNDRLGVGTRRTSIAALRRLSALPVLKERGCSLLNSEEAFKHQLLACSVTTARAHFPFCILSHRQYAWAPTGAWVPPVAALDRTAVLNGAKCCPCLPAATANESQPELLPLLGVQPGATGVRVRMCNAQGPWDANWDSLFDAVAGPAATAARKSILGRSFKECVTENRALQASARLYRGPPPAMLCLLGTWGSPEVTGPEGDPWPLHLAALHAQSVVYTACMACSLQWEVAMTQGGVYKNFHVFNSLPNDKWWRATREEKRLKRSVFLHKWCIGPVDRGQCDNSLYVPAAVSASSSVPEQHVEEGGAGVAKKRASVVPRRQLSSSMEELHHQMVDVLRIDLLGAEAALIERWDVVQADLPVCQLLLRFGPVVEGQRAGGEGRERVFQSLNRLGFWRIKCIGTYTDERCVFVSSTHCLGARYE
eukprot:jgi/Mesen1/1979/ME000147S01072